MLAIESINSCYLPDFLERNPACRLFLNIPILLCELNEDGEIMFINPAVYTIAGYDPHELTGKKWELFFDTDKEPGSSSVIDELKNLSNLSNYETTAQKKDGSQACILWNFTKFNLDGGSVSILGFGIDISERKEIEEKLAENEERFRFLSDISTEGIIIHEVGKIISINKKFAEIFGYTLDDLPLKKEFCEAKSMVTPESFNTISNRIMKNIEGPYEVEGIKKDGTHFPLYVIVKNVEYKGKIVRVAIYRDITKEKEYQARLISERNLFNNIAELSPTGIVLLNSEGRITFVNKQAEEIFGRQKDEMYKLYHNSPVWNFRYCDGRNVPEEEIGFEIIKRTGKPLFGVCVIVARSDGTDIKVSFNNAPIYDNYGNFNGAITTVEDITAKVEAEQKLQETNMALAREKNLLQNIMDTSPIGILLGNAEGRIIFSNKQVEEILGRSKDMLVKLSADSPDWNFRYCDGRPVSEEEIGFNIVKRTGKSLYSQCIIVKRLDGTDVKVSFNNAPLYDNNGNFDGVIATMEDITAKIEAEQKLQETNMALARERNLLQNVMETSPIGIGLENAEGRVIFSNKRTEEILGRSKDELHKMYHNSPGWNYRYCDGSKVPEENIGFEIVKRTGKPLFDVCVIVARPDGTDVKVSFNNAPLYDNNGNFEGVIVTAEDITTKIEAEQKLQETNNSLTREKNLLQNIMETSPIAILIYDKNGTMQFVNKMATEISGFSKSELEGMENFDSHWNMSDINGSPVPVEERIFNTVMNARKPQFGMTYRVLFPSNKMIIFRVNAVPLFDEKGEIVSIIATFMDITENIEKEKKLEETNNALAREKNLLQNIMETSPTGIFIYNKDNTIIFANRMAEKIFGIRKSELEGTKNFDEYWNVIDLEGNPIPIKERVFLKTLNSGEPQFGLIHGLVKSDGRIQMLSINTVPIYDEKMNIISVVSTFEDITDKLRREAELAETNKAIEQEKDLLEKIMETSPTGIIIYDKNGTVKFINRIAEETFGVNRLELEGIKNFDSLWSIVDLDGNPVPIEERMFAKTLNSRKSQFGMIQGFKSGDGRIRMYSLNSAPIYNEKMEVESVILTFEEITDKLRKEKELAETNKAIGQEKDLLEKIMETSPTGIIIFTKNGQIRYANRQAEELLELTKDELIKDKLKRNIWIFTYPDGTAVPEDDRIIARVKKAGGACFNIIRGVTKQDGTVKILMLNAAPLFDEKGEIFEVITTFEDITEDRKIQQEIADYNVALKRERDLFSRIMETSPTGIVIFTREGNLTYSNKQAEMLLELNNQEIRKNAEKGIWILKNIDGSEVQYDKKVYSIVAREKKAIFNISRLMKKSDGTITYLSVNAGPLFDEKGEVSEIIVIVEDITERMNAERELHRLNRQLDQRATELSQSNAELEHFAFIASHDLKEPLNVILGYARLFEKRYKDKLDPNAQNFIGYITEEAVRMQKLINGLLQIARVSTRGKPFTLVDMNEVINKVLFDLQDKIEESKAEITVDNLPTVMADEVQMGQVFQNLIINSIKFRSSAPLKIGITAKKQETEWLFSVSDNGIGIEKSDMSRIFKIFQTSKSAPESATGTGIGLSIAQRIINRHGGHIWFDSESGKGTTFYFTIPFKS